MGRGEGSLPGQVIYGKKPKKQMRKRQGYKTGKTTSKTNELE